MANGKLNRSTGIFSHLQVQLPDSTDTITVDNIISVIKLVYYTQCLVETGLTQQGATQRKTFSGRSDLFVPKIRVQFRFCFCFFLSFFPVTGPTILGIGKDVVGLRALCGSVFLKAIIIMINTTNLEERAIPLSFNFHRNKFQLSFDSSVKVILSLTGESSLCFSE